jgi:type IV pilus assembly protein PilA
VSEHLPQAGRRDGGFTLLELLAVMVVLGLLMGVAAPLYLSAKRHAYRTAVQADLRSARVQIETWVQDQPDGYLQLDNDYFHNSHGLKWKGTAGVEISVSNNPSPTLTTYCLKGSHPRVPDESWRFKGGVDSHVLKLSCKS